MSTINSNTTKSDIAQNKGNFVENCNEHNNEVWTGFNTPSCVVCMKIIYVGPIHDTKLERGSLHPGLSFLGGGGTPLWIAHGLFFSLSEKSERDLPASKRENDWRVAYRSRNRDLLHCSWPSVFFIASPILRPVILGQARPGILQTCQTAPASLLKSCRWCCFLFTCWAVTFFGHRMLT